MSLPHDEAGMRELDQKCESREAAASKRTVTRLQAQTPGFREAFMIGCSTAGLANLARCKEGRGEPRGAQGEARTRAVSKALLSSTFSRPF